MYKPIKTNQHGFLTASTNPGLRLVHCLQVRIEEISFNPSRRVNPSLEKGCPAGGGGVVEDSPGSTTVYEHFDFKRVIRRGDSTLGKEQPEVVKREPFRKVIIER